MRESIKKLREAYRAYVSARQARYDEITGNWSGRRDTDACYEAHKAAVEQIDLEMTLPTHDEVEAAAFTVGPLYLDEYGSIVKVEEYKRFA